MKRIFLRFASLVLLFSVATPAFAQAPKNLILRASIDFSPQTLAGCWHYEASGRSYALVGASGGLIVIDVTVPDTPLVILQVPGINNLWREVKVEGQYAYLTTEGTDSTGVLNGIQIVNLSYLPDSAPSKIYKGDGVILNELQSGHSITSSGEYIYINGHNIVSQGRGVLICNISDPWNPVFVGAVTNNYCHDSYVRGDTIWTSDIIAGQFSVYDISDRTNPVLLATQQTPGNFNHNSWLSDDGQTLYTTDERSNEPLGSFDVSDLNNITLLDTYYATNFSTSEVHNVRVLNDFLINPSYGSQLTLVDAARPSNLIEVGNYTTGNYLLWDADPYFSSGIIAATETTPGIFYVFEPVYQRACYLEGIITDSVTGVPIPSATIQILSTGIQKSSKGTGNYYTGVADPGTYDVLVTKNGYAAKQATGVVLATGLVTLLDFELRPLGAGVNSINESDGIYISPNPFNNSIKVESKLHRLEKIEMFNILGEKIDEWDQARLTFLLNTQKYSPGIYMMKIFSGEKVLLRKLIKQ
jgi:choice-of-anchor B domain-containing protein